MPCPAALPAPLHLYSCKELRSTQCTKVVFEKVMSPFSIAAPKADITSQSQSEGISQRHFGAGESSCVSSPGTDPSLQQKTTIAQQGQGEDQKSSLLLSVQCCSSDSSQLHCAGRFRHPYESALVLPLRGHVFDTVTCLNKAYLLNSIPGLTFPMRHSLRIASIYSFLCDLASGKSGDGGGREAWQTSTSPTFQPKSPSCLGQQPCLSPNTLLVTKVAQESGGLPFGAGIES